MNSDTEIWSGIRFHSESLEEKLESREAEDLMSQPSHPKTTGTGRAAGHYSIAGAARPGEAREPSAAQEGAGDHVPRRGEEEAGDAEPLSRARSAAAAVAAAGAGCRKSKHFGRKSES